MQQKRPLATMNSGDVCKKTPLRSGAVAKYKKITRAAQGGCPNMKINPFDLENAAGYVEIGHFSSGEVVRYDN